MNARKFFDKFPRLLEYGVANSRDRLEYRYDQIISPNLDLIKRNTILDIGSHNGRWTLALLENGAKNVIGVEPRGENWIESDINLKNSDYDKYYIYRADIHRSITDFRDEEFDCVFCCGFLYHTTSIEFMIREMSRVSSHSIIIDTYTNGRSDLTATFKREDSDSTGNIYRGAWVSVPSVKLVAELLKYYGFEKPIGIETAIPDGAKDLEDYRSGLRVTIRGEK